MGQMWSRCLIQKAALHKNPPTGWHTTQSMYLVQLEVSSQSKSWILKYLTAPNCRGKREGALERRRFELNGSSVYLCHSFRSFLLFIFKLGAFPSIRKVGTNLLFLVFFWNCLCWTIEIPFYGRPILFWMRHKCHSGKESTACSLARSLSSALTLSCT